MSDTQLLERIAKLESVCDFLLKKFDNYVGADITCTDRQHMIAKLVVRGYDNAEIAAQTHVSIGTVKAEIGKLFKILGVSKRSQIYVPGTRPISDASLVTFSGNSVGDKALYQAGLKAALTLLNNEIEHCTCDDAINHLKQRLETLLPKENEQ